MNESVMPSETSRQLRKRLSAPFPVSGVNAIEWKPQSVLNNRALAIAYIDARAVMKRLDDVLGVDGWEDSYEVLADGCVVCTLKCLLDVRWVTKQDVGGESDQKDEADRRKASFSDAFKRAAVKFGVGRYLYSLPVQWVPYDVHKRCFTEAPRLPTWAIPKKEQVEAPAPAPEPQPQPRNGTHTLDGKKLMERILAREALLVGTGRCQSGELVDQVVKNIAKRFGSPVPPWEQWSQSVRQCAIDAVAAFEALHPATPVLENGTEASGSERISEKQIAELTALLERKGRTWAVIAPAAGLVPDTRMNEISTDDFDRIVAKLNQEFDRPAAARK